MKKKTLFLSFIFSLSWFLLAGTLSAQNATGSETNTLPSAEQMLRSNLHLQEQLHSALRVIERSRQDADSAAKQNAELFTEKLNAVEKNLALERERDLSTIVSLRQSNRMVLIAAAVLAGVGVLALFVTAYFQIRAMNRMSEIGAVASSNVSFDAPRSLTGASSVVPAQLNSADQANNRFLAAVEQLEKRIHELDGTNFGSSRHATKIDLIADSGEGDLTVVNNGSTATDDSLLGKGQTWLTNGEPEKALGCFEEALKLDPNNTEALVKKGSALESLRKLPEAIEAYDRAIAIDESLTVAYLYKGGVLNRMQRFAEAMECYEKALGNNPQKAA